MICSERCGKEEEEEKEEKELLPQGIRRRLCIDAVVKLNLGMRCSVR